MAPPPFTLPPPSLETNNENLNFCHSKAFSEEDAHCPLTQQDHYQTQQRMVGVVLRILLGLRLTLRQVHDWRSPGQACLSSRLQYPSPFVHSLFLPPVMPHHLGGKSSAEAYKPSRVCFHNPPTLCPSAALLRQMGL